MNKKHMSKENLLIELINRVESAFDSLGIRYIKKTQFNSMVDAMMFKMSGNRAYGYVLRKDKTNSTARSNLVFRFKSGDHPKNWFKENDIPKTARSWQERFIRVWSEETDTHEMMREPSKVTDQFGIRVSEEELGAGDFDESLQVYVRIAAAAAMAANSPKNRDWSEYEDLIV